MSMQMYMDPKLSYVPTSLMNFVIRTVLYMMWCMLLWVAEGIRQGLTNRPLYKPQLSCFISCYHWKLYASTTAESIRLN